MTLLWSSALHTRVPNSQWLLDRHDHKLQVWALDMLKASKQWPGDQVHHHCALCMQKHFKYAKSFISLTAAACRSEILMYLLLSKEEQI
jgi:hypothetical protein